MHAYILLFPHFYHPHYNRHHHLFPPLHPPPSRIQFCVSRLAQPFRYYMRHVDLLPEEAEMEFLRIVEDLEMYG